METRTTTPLSHPKSAKKLEEFNSESETNEIPHYQVEYAPSPLASPPAPRQKPVFSSPTPSKLSVTKTRGCLPMHELLLNLSPSPVRKSRTRLSDRLDMVDEQSGDHRRKCKSRVSGNGLSGCGSPRVLRRVSRRRVDGDERDIVGLDEGIKTRKRRISGKSKKDRVNSAVLSKDNDGGENALDRLGSMIWELVMWTDVAKSSLWFGFGCLGFMSSCFTKGLSISLFSVISQIGLVFLAVSFISNTLQQNRESAPKSRVMCLKEDDFLKAIRVVLPALNLAISKARELFSGEPSMTLKVASFFLFGAEYGHLLTIWRLLVLGFFTSFTVPKFYCSYSAQIDGKVNQYKSTVLEAWGACYHKKIVVASVATVFWNLSCLKTRVFAAFISLVLLRYYRQHADSKMDEDGVPSEKNIKLQGKPTMAEELVKEIQQALVVAKEKKSDK